MPTVLVTGANRGIGLAFVQAFVKNSWDVIAAVRNPSSMPKIQDEGKGKVLAVKYDAGSRASAREAIKEVKERHGIDKLDAVIANAGIGNVWAKMAELDIDEAENVWRINVLGPLVLFQASYQMIPKSGKFIVISSGAAAMSFAKVPGNGAYGQSKAACNYLITKLHVEHPDLCCVALSPGWVATDMGTETATKSGKDAAPDDLKVTMPSMIKVIESMNRDTLGGKFVNWDGKIRDW